MPYGMREIDGYGENTWEFFNRQYESIGAPFQFVEELTNSFLDSISDDFYGMNYGTETGSRMVIFGTISDDRGCKNLRRIARVMALPIQGEIEEIARELPKTWHKKFDSLPHPDGDAF
ncbi:hypothetical protein ZL54_22500 [Salmonella enterica subsp. enterica]|nr:hypothetical protein [Salmonella enterica subsp. enterica]